ncbi:MAG: endonuclease/exonuclease/phosphatase family protein [Pyrinomonadaceae bacterium]
MLAKLIYILGTVGILLTVLPLLRFNVWWIRVWDFPRLQIFIVLALVTAGGLLAVREWHAAYLIFICFTAACSIYQLYCILPYTFIYPNQVEDARSADPKRGITIIASNVLLENKNSEDLLAMLSEIQPDLVLLAETDDDWIQKLEPLRKEYPYSIDHPLGNAFGIAFFSRLELIDPEIKFLIEDDIPSVHTKVRLRSGEIVRFYGLHPRPPVPTETEDSTERDAELIVVAKEIKKEKLPVIVAGDLNDAAWSRTTLLFQKISGMLDPRIGRGFYNSFHANYFFLRMPLDHFFHTSHFRLVELRRERYVGSDHFPMYISLRLEDSAKSTQQEYEANSNDRKMAEDMIDEAKEKEK